MIASHKLAPVLNGQSSEIGVRNHRPSDFGPVAQVDKYIPVSWARLNDSAIGCIAQRPYKCERIGCANRRGKESGLRDDSDNRTQHQFGNRECCGAVY